MKSESVIPVEVLKTFGDLLATGVDAEIAAAWKKNSSVTDLPPFNIKDDDWNDVGATQREEAAWYARKLEIDVDTFVNGSIALNARHLQWACGGEGGQEALYEHQNPYTWAPISETEAMALIHKIPDKYPETPEQVVESSIAYAIDGARQRIIYGRKPWPRSGSAGMTP